jgi:hypothetical protein
MEEDLVQQQNPHFVFLQFCAFFVWFWPVWAMFLEFCAILHIHKLLPPNNKTEVLVYIQKLDLLLSYTNIVKVPTYLLDVHLSLKGNPASSEPPSFRLGISNGNSKETRIPFAHLKC